MPIFDYECRDCGHRFDTLQKAADPALTDCPACGHPALRKLLSAPSFHLKGSGWRNSKEQAPARKPRMAHMLDRPTPHAEHHDHGHDHGHAHAHAHGHDHSH